jgi:hypothetical protein
VIFLSLHYGTSEWPISYTSSQIFVSFRYARYIETVDGCLGVVQFASRIKKTDAVVAAFSGEPGDNTLRPILNSDLETVLNSLNVLLDENEAKAQFQFGLFIIIIYFASLGNSFFTKNLATSTIIKRLKFKL